MPTQPLNLYRLRSLANPDVIFLILVALASIAIDIATNRWHGLRAETKTALLIETAIFLDRIAIYCEVVINCLKVDVIYKYSMVGYYYYYMEITRSLFPACFVGTGNIWSRLNCWMEARYSHDDACARNHAMLIYLIVTSLILVGSSAHCFLVATCLIVFGNYAIVPSSYFVVV